MGCGASGGCKKDDRRKAERIEYDMDDCNVAEFDSMFKEIRDLLQIMEETRAGLRETVDDIKEMCEIERLKNPTFEECIRVWMWAIAANNDGDINKAGFNVTSDLPFFEVNCSGCTWEAWWINDYFNKFIKTAFEMPAKVADALVALVGLGEKIANLDPAGAIESSGLNPWDQALAIKAFASNTKTAVEGVARAKQVGEIIGEAAGQVKSLVDNMKIWLAESNEWGKKAYEKSLWRPHQIVRELHPGPHKTPEELKKYEEMMMENKCDCQKCLREAEEQAKKDKK